MLKRRKQQANTTTINALHDAHGNLQTDTKGKLEAMQQHSQGHSHANPRRTTC
jgi:hypothetical protein